MTKKPRKKRGVVRAKIVQLAKQYYKTKEVPNDTEKDEKLRDGSFCVHDVMDELDLKLNDASRNLQKLADEAQAVVRLTNRYPCMSLTRRHDRFRYVPLGKKTPEHRLTKEPKKKVRTCDLAARGEEHEQVETSKLPRDTKEVLIRVTKNEVTVRVTKG